jgi:hypothetical protein
MYSDEYRDDDDGTMPDEFFKDISLEKEMLKDLATKVVDGDLILEEPPNRTPQRPDII